MNRLLELLALVFLLLGVLLIAAEFSNSWLSFIQLVVAPKLRMGSWDPARATGVVTNLVLGTLFCLSCLLQIALRHSASASQES